VVRVNAVGSAHFERDVADIAAAGTDIINLPMAEDVSAVTTLAARLEKLEKPEANPISILVNIETAKSLRNAAALAAAHPRVIGLQIGYADMLEPAAIDRRDETALAYIRMAVRLAAAEAGVAAYDGAFAGVSDPDFFRAECIAANRHGFAGKTCIHPSQIAIANEAFMPGAKQIERARKIVAAAEDPANKGVGAFLVDGQMIDKPFLERARAIVALADAVAQKKD
jgi:citrate lyase subunit beta/citryl-CoA lyase